MNHFRPLITQSSPSRTAEVWMSVGSDPATSGSVSATGKILKDQLQRATDTALRSGATLTASSP
jgi:hypothetical protein